MNLPTKITLIRILLIPAFVAVFFLDVIPYNRLIALGIFALASLTDWLDGYLARRLNLITDLGKFLDPIADKLLVMSALLAVIVTSDRFVVALAVSAMIILARELTISVFRIMAASNNKVLAADKIGKIKTVIQMLALLLFIPLADIVYLAPGSDTPLRIIGLVLMLTAVVLTVASGGWYIIRNRSVLANKPQEGQKTDAE